MSRPPGIGAHDDERNSVQLQGVGHYRMWELRVHAWVEVEVSNSARAPSPRFSLFHRYLLHPIPQEEDGDGLELCRR